MRTPEYRPRACIDIESIVTYIGQVLDSPKAARAWYENLQATVAQLCEMPDLGRPFTDDLLAVTDRRSYLVGNYRLFYSYSDETLIVWRVVHTTQDMDVYALVELVD